MCDGVGVFVFCLHAYVHVLSFARGNVTNRAYSALPQRNATHRHKNAGLWRKYTFVRAFTALSVRLCDVATKHFKCNCTHRGTHYRTRQRPIELPFVTTKRTHTHISEQIAQRFVRGPSPHHNVACCLRHPTAALCQTRHTHDAVSIHAAAPAVGPFHDAISNVIDKILQRATSSVSIVRGARTLLIAWRAAFISCLLRACAIGVFSHICVTLSSTTMR